MTTEQPSGQVPKSEKGVPAPENPTDRAVRETFKKALDSEPPIRAPLTLDEVRRLREPDSTRSR